jgi:hypothetical protein
MGLGPTRSYPACPLSDQPMVQGIAEGKAVVTAAYD